MPALNSSSLWFQPGDAALPLRLPLQERSGLMSGATCCVGGMGVCVTHPRGVLAYLGSLEGYCFAFPNEGSDVSKAKIVNFAL